MPFDAELQRALSVADRALGEFLGPVDNLPNSGLGKLRRYQLREPAIGFITQLAASADRKHMKRYFAAGACAKSKISLIVGACDFNYRQALAESAPMKTGSRLLIAQCKRSGFERQCGRLSTNPKNSPSARSATDKARCNSASNGISTGRNGGIKGLSIPIIYHSNRDFL